MAKNSIKKDDVKQHFAIQQQQQEQQHFIIRNTIRRIINHNQLKGVDLTGWDSTQLIWRGLTDGQTDFLFWTIHNNFNFIDIFVAVLTPSPVRPFRSSSMHSDFVYILMLICYSHIKILQVNDNIGTPYKTIVKLSKWWKWVIFLNIKLRRDYRSQFFYLAISAIKQLNSDSKSDFLLVMWQWMNYGSISSHRIQNKNKSLRRLFNDRTLSAQ